jgi:tetratricopeptide (TPR) repeat protein
MTPLRRTLIVGLLATVMLAPIPSISTAEAARPEASQAGSRYYDKAVRLAQSRRYKKAIAMFEKALPFYRDSSDIYYNLVNLTDATRQWDRLWTYGQAFLFLQPDGNDAREVRTSLKKAAVGLKKAEKMPVEVRFEVSPAGVQILVDGMPMARADRGSIRLVPGRYTATATKEDHRPFEQRFEVKPGVAMVVRGTLDKKIYFGALAITHSPPMASPSLLMTSSSGRAPSRSLSVWRRDAI